jgi:hypothetical protein
LFHLAQRHESVPSVPSVPTLWRVLRERGFVIPEPHKRPRSSWARFAANLHGPSALPRASAQRAGRNHGKALIFAPSDAVNGLAAARLLAEEIEADHLGGVAPRSAQDMFTVRRLGVGGSLAATLATADCTESMI